MLDLLGRGYVIEHCISSFKNKSEHEIYKTYVTDALQAIANMYSKAHGGSGDVVTQRYFDLIHPAKPKKEETAEDIIERIKRKLGG